MDTEQTSHVHCWESKFFKKPTWCGVCSGFLWGVANKQGIKCSECKLIIHPDCQLRAGQCIGKNHHKGKKVQQGEKDLILIFTCNDVYSLKNFGRFSKYIEDTVARMKPTKYFVTMAGDFLSPSMLSCLDKGKIKVELMNRTPFTHVSLGNHEFDLSLKVLNERLTEMNSVVLNSNISGFPDDLTEPYSISDIREDFSIGFLGFCTSKTHDISINVPQTIKIDHIPTVFEKTVDYLKKTEKVDFVIALTHQDIDEDVQCGENSSVDMILGGHEHEPFLLQKKNRDGEMIWVTKVGSDLSHFGFATMIVDEKKKVEVNFERIQITDDMPTKQDLEDFATKGNEMAENAKSRIISKDPFLATEGRSKDQSFYQFLLTNIRKFYSVDLAYIHSKTFQCIKDYPDGITIADIFAEFYKFSQITEAFIPAKILIDHVESYRNQSGKRFLQMDDGVTFFKNSNILSHINFKEIDLEKKYKVFLPLLISKKKNDGDNLKYLCPILSKYFEENPKDLVFNPTHQPISITTTIFQSLIPSFKKSIFKGLTFSSLDTNKDGVLRKKELEPIVGEDGARAMFLLASKSSGKEILFCLEK